MTKKKNSLGQEIYTGTADAGRIFAWISAITGTIIGIVFIVIGIYIIIHKGHLTSVDGTVQESPTCVTQINNNISTTTCKFEAKYNVNNKSYTKTFSSTSTYQKGESVTIWYDPNHPDQSEIDPPSKTIGWIIIAMSILVVIGGWVWVWITYRSKTAAAIGGVAGAINLIRN